MSSCFASPELKPVEFDKTFSGCKYWTTVSNETFSPFLRLWNWTGESNESWKNQETRQKGEGTEGCLYNCVFMMGCPLFPLLASGSAVDQHKRLLRFFFLLLPCKAWEKCWAKINDLNPLTMSKFWRIQYEAHKTHGDASCLLKWGRSANLAPHLIKGIKNKTNIFALKSQRERNKPTCLCQRIGTSSPHTKHKPTEHNTDVTKDSTFNL